MKDLFVVGAGELGARVAKLWRSQTPDAKVICETLTPRSHPALSASGLVPRLREDSLAERYPNVLVAIPPSQAVDYDAEMKRAGDIWDGKGTLLVISSTGVYLEDEGGEIDEKSPLADTDRARVLLSAEVIVQGRGGAVLRLVGLYSDTKGPHLAYARRDSSPLNGEGWVNLIHYDDAASLAVTILRERHTGIFLGCEAEPIKRRDVGPTCRFTGTQGDLGKRCRNDWTRATTGWKPTHSFQNRF